MPDITIKNPKHIRPQLDTGRPASNPNKYVKMDVSNPPAGPLNVASPNYAAPAKPHPIDELFGRGTKRSNGRSIPREDVQISDN